MQDFEDLPELLDQGRPDEILQLGVAPNRVNLLRSLGEARFEDVWKRRVLGRYGRARAHWIDLDSLIAVKSGVDHPRHREDARILKLVRDRKLGDD